MSVSSHTLFKFTIAGAVLLSTGFATLCLVPITCRARNSTHSLLRFVLFLSLTLVALAGILGINCIASPPSNSSATAAGVAGLLSILSLNTYLICTVWAWERNSGAAGWRAMSFVAFVAPFLAVSTALHGLLLASTTHGMAIPALRTASQVALDIMLAVFFARAIQRRKGAARDEGSVSSDRSRPPNSASYTTNRFSNPWRPPSVSKATSHRSQAKRTFVILFTGLHTAFQSGLSSKLWDIQAFRLLILQPLSIILFVAGISFPVDYLLPIEEASSNLDTPFTLLGTRTSPNGAIFLSVLQVLRWISVAVEMTLCRESSPFASYQLEELQLQHVLSRPSNSATYDSNSPLNSNHKYKSSLTTRGPLSPTSSSIPYIHGNNIIKKGSTGKRPASKLNYYDSVSSSTGTSLGSNSRGLASPPSTFEPRTGTPPLLSTYSPGSRGQQKETHRPPPLAALHLSLDSSFGAPFEVSQGYSPISTPVQAYNPGSSPPSPKSSRNVHRRAGGSDASAIEIDVEGGDPFAREPSVEATEEMWRKKVGLARDSEDLNGSLRRELKRVEEEWSTTELDDTPQHFVREGAPSPSPPRTPRDPRVKVNVIAATPSPVALRTAESSPKKRLPSSYEDPFPAPQPTYRFIAGAVTRPHASAPPSGDHVSKRHSRPSLPSAWSSSSSDSTIKGWSASASFAIKKMRKSKLQMRGGSRDSTHSDDSFSCIGDAVDAQSPPNHPRHHDNYASIESAASDEVERIDTYTQDDVECCGEEVQPGGLKPLRLPQLLEEDTRNAAEDGRKDWWRGSPSPTSQSDPGMGKSTWSRARSASTTSTIDFESRSRTTTPSSHSPPFSLELAYSAQPRSSKSSSSPSNRSVKASSRRSRPSAESRRPSFSSLPSTRVSPFAVSENEDPMPRNTSLEDSFDSIILWGEGIDKGDRRALNASNATSSTPDDLDSQYTHNRSVVANSIACSTVSTAASEAESERSLLPRENQTYDRRQNQKSFGDNLSLAMLLEQEDNPDFKFNTPPKSRLFTHSHSPDTSASSPQSDEFSFSSLSSPASPLFSLPSSQPDTPDSSVFGMKERDSM